MIYAVIWLDFIPLSLECDTAQSAIDSAKAIHERSNGQISYIRAVALAEGSNKLETLWSATPCESLSQ